MMLHPFLAWILFGVIVAGVVRASVGRLPHHRSLQPFFYGGIVLAGPLIIILTLIPGDYLYRVTGLFRKRVDEKHLWP